MATLTGAIHHRHHSTLPNGTSDIDVDEWNDSLIIAGGSTGQVLARDDAQADGWGWTAAMARTDVGNTFTGDQTIHGDLHVSGAINPLDVPPKLETRAGQNVQMSVSSDGASGIVLSHDPVSGYGELATGDYATGAFHDMNLEAKAVHVYLGATDPPAAQITFHPSGGVTLGAEPQPDPGIGVLAAGSLIANGRVDARSSLGLAEVRLTDLSAAADKQMVRLLASQESFRIWTAKDDSTPLGSAKLDRSGNWSVSGALMEANRSTPVGWWIPATPVTSTNGGAWSMDQIQSYSYALVGKTLLWECWINGTMGAGGASYILFNLPGGVTAHVQSAVHPVPYLLLASGEVPGLAYMVNSTQLLVRAITNAPLVAGPCSLAFSIAVSLN
jgi:hypothetical protein